MKRGIRQGDPLSPKLFTAVIEDVFKKAGIPEGINADGENLTNLRFADDVALFHEKNNTNGKTLKQCELRKSEVGAKILKRKKKHTTNHTDSEDILKDRETIEKVTEFKYLGQTTHLKDTTKEVCVRIREAWSCFGKKKQGNSPR